MTTRSTERTDPSSLVIPLSSETTITTSTTTETSAITTTTTAATTNMETEHTLPTLAEFPVTPTFQTAELQHGHPVSTPTVDFDTAAYMLMANDEDFHLPTHSPGIRISSATNSPVFQTGKLPLPFITSLSGAGTPPAFDFDSIGQMLMSPNSNSFANAAINNISFSSQSEVQPQIQSQVQYSTQQFPPDLLAGFASHLDKSPRLNLPALASIQGDAMDGSFKDYLPWSAPSPTSRLFASSLNSPSMANTIPSPVIGMSQLPTGFPAVSGPVSQGIIQRNSTVLDSAEPNTTLPTAGLGFLDISKRPANLVLANAQNKELLSNTETLALESFLDSIANEGMVSKAKSKTVKGAIENNRKRKFDKAVGETSNIEKDVTKFPKKVEKLVPRPEGMAAEETKPLMTKQERKLVHNLTEQKRRDMIKEAFDCLHELIKNSRFELEDKALLQQQAKKRKRKRGSTDRPMKKFEVLKRSVREIEILLEKNRSLYALLNEKETEI